MKKKNGAGLAGSSIYAMWNKGSKAKKIDETSTPNQIVVESSASHDEVENNQVSPSSAVCTEAGGNTHHHFPGAAVDLGTYLCALDDEAVSHGYRRNSRGTVWAVELAGDDYVRLQGQRGLYLGATELPADVLGTRGRGTRVSCRVVQGTPSCPNDNAFLWSPLREGEHLTLSGPYGRLLRARFGDTPQDNAITVDLDAVPEESSWVVEPVVVPPPPVAASEAAPICRAKSCGARLEATASVSDTASSVFARFHFHSAKESKGKLLLEEEAEKEKEEPSSEEEELLWKPAPRTIFYNTARDDGGVDDFDDGTWKYFAFNEQSLVALHRRLGEETSRRGDFVVCRRSAAAPRPLFPVVLDLPPGNADMEFVLVPVVSSAVAESVL